jgi:hypothetical protein
MASVVVVAVQPGGQVVEAFVVAGVGPRVGPFEVDGLNRSALPLLRVAEDGIYIGVGLLLTVGGIALLIQAASASPRSSRPRLGVTPVTR